MGSATVESTPVGSSNLAGSNFSASAVWVDLVSSVFKGVHDLSIDGDNHGAFVRFNYWYDYVISEEEMPHGHSPNGYFPNKKLNDDAFVESLWFIGKLQSGFYKRYSNDRVVENVIRCKSFK